MQTISRLYKNEEDARKAWDELKRRGFADSFLFTPPPPADETAAPAAPGHLLEDMLKAQILRSEAAAYAQHVSQGASLVTVHAPFTGGKRATYILERHGPGDYGIEQPTFPTYMWDETAPLSSALRWPLLAKTKLPFETISGIPSLIRTNHGSGVAARPDTPAPLSAALGLPVLSSDPTPLSSLVQLPVLLKSKPLFY